MDYYKKMVEYMIQGYSTSIEDDEKALINSELDYKKRFCIILRLEQKKILQK